jgi:hypothetical protein
VRWIDPEFLPEIEGTLERFMLNPKREIDGLVLTDETLVHVPPHLGRAVKDLLQLGKTVRVHGFRPRGTAMIAAVWLANPHDRSIIDNGSDERKKDSASAGAEPQPTGAAGTVRPSLYARRGKLRGVLLTDGTIVCARTEQAQQWPQAALAVRGNGLETRFGRVVDAIEIGTDLASLTPVKGTDAKKKKPAPPTERSDGSENCSDLKWGRGQPERRLRMRKLIVASACHFGPARSAQTHH